MSKNKVSTNRKTRFSWSRNKVDILKLDHYFFNTNSALFFPVKLPDGGDPDSLARAALDVLGIKSLAVVFKHLEDDNRLRIVIAGHADSSDDEGGVSDRYKLSELRAKSVFSLLAGDRDAFAEAVHAKHHIRDYQLLLKYMHLNKEAYFGAVNDEVKVLDPGKANDSWNDDTDKAVRNFIVGFNAYAKVRELDSLKLSELMKSIKADGQKRWPIEMWNAVFALYENAVRRVLGLKKSGLEDKREKILKVCDDLAPIVACGESTPLKTLNDQKKSNYEPEPGRGIEILFFRNNQLPGRELLKKMRIVCPDEAGRTHEAKECPIFYKHHMKATYIDHRNLDLIIYHLKFVYYDRMLKDIAAVPEGLTIEATHWNEATSAKEPIDAVTDYSDGVYTVKVPDSDRRKNIAFWFKAVDAKDPAKRQWVYTEAAAGTPRLVLKTDDEIKALSPADRLKYYDLPKEWCSLNYWTRFEKYTVGDPFQQLMKKKKFKPYGANQMEASKPLMYSLDDLVLLTDGTGKQELKDKDHDDDPKALSKHSRVTLLYADPDDEFKIKIHKPFAKEPYFSEVEGGFKKNLIHDCWYDADGNLHWPCRAVVFCSDFYDVYNKRTEMHPDFKFNKGHILGARAVLKDDSEVSGKKSFSGWDAADKASAYVCNGAGNYRLHYLHDWGVYNNKLHSGLVLYWSCRFTVDGAQGGKNIDKRHYIEEGMKNAMDRIGLKKYQLEKLAGLEDIIIKTFPLFEAKQDYKVGTTRIKRGGKHLCLVNLVDDTHTSSMGFDTATFRHSSYQDEPNRFAVNDPENNRADYDGRTFNPITGAHEIGHALGLDDEYIQTAASRVGLAQYEQYYPGVPYSLDLLSLMNKNRGTRMHQYWLYVNWINDAALVGGALNDMLKATSFKLALRGPGFDALEFDLTHADYRNIYKPVWEGDIDYGGGAHGYLIVYKLGDGEFANNLKAGEKFKGIMVVRTNIRVSYANDTQNWTGDQMVDWIQALDSDLKLMLDKKYWLECDTADHTFAKVYMYFLPHYSTDDPAPAGTHYQLRVKKNGNNGFNPDAGDKSKIEVDNNVDNKKIIRHFFGQFAGTTNLSKAELVEIKDWIEDNTRANDTFSIEDLA